jgi:predicted metalloprotease with PDZ domain
MRRFQALLIAAGLVAMTPVTGALADTPRNSEVTIERHEVFTSRGRLGVMLIGLTPELRKHLGAAEDRGVLVARVERGSPAEAAGIAVGDVIVEARGRGVAGAMQILSAIEDVHKGERADFLVVRDRAPVTVQVTMTEDAAPRMHMRMFDDDDDAFFAWPDHWREMSLEHRGRHGRGPRWLPELMKPWRAPPPRELGEGATGA